MSLLDGVFASHNAPAAVRNAALERAHRDPGIPTQKDTTKSFWLKDKHPGADNFQTNNAAPATVDVAIIGSGITGLSVAHTILGAAGENGCPTHSVMVLEARDLCSGATGRNGGHLLETVSEYLDFKKAFGKEDAIRLIKFRRGHLDAIKQLVGSDDLLKEYSQLREVEFVSVYFDEALFNEAAKNLAAFKKDMPEEACGFHHHQGQELAEKFGLSKHAIGAITGPAGAVWPSRLVTHVFDDLLKKHPGKLFVRTNTPVTWVETQEDQKTCDYPYRLTTPHGIVFARHIVHCTNAHIGHLVPGFRGRVIPLRGQMSAQEPGTCFKSQGKQRSWVFNYRTGFDYLTQLPRGGVGSAEEMMLGGGLPSMPHQGIDEIGVATDEELHLTADIHLSGALSAVFGRENWGSSLGVKHMWTGIMGFSPDNFPWVGELPQTLTTRPASQKSPGREWAAAGFCGEGMVQAWGSGKALEHVPSAGNAYSLPRDDIPLMRMPHLEFVYRIVAEMGREGVSTIPSVDDTTVTREVLPIHGGTVHGPNIQGIIVPRSGADWAETIHPEKAFARLHARYTLQTHDGAYILVLATGIFNGGPGINKETAEKSSVSQDEVEYFTQIRFEAPGHSLYGWMNAIVAIGVMIMSNDRPIIDCYRLTNFPGQPVATI
ncbi:hypothetical protein AK830_g1361 [Neonectria ditissima]|uniref:FAD dependent oxidoreductase domain-containing protein n=1 Tax=Neonectria ditissima TaxID=78410 RepID=A0A0P7BZU9_9HYPO|nr:hypothetical protein AK830_g1361 [Neonectria ditissima]